MSPATLERFANGPIAAGMTGGFEMELTLPGDLKPTRKADEAIPKEVTFDMIRDFFAPTGHIDIDDIENDFEHWLDRQYENFINLTWSHISDTISKETPDINIRDLDSEIRYRIDEMWHAEIPSLYDFLKKRFRNTTYQSVSTYYDSSWPESHSAATSFAEDFNKTFGVKSVIQGYHATSKKDDTWYFETDGSIRPDDDYFGIELVSPPMAVPEMVGKLKECMSWAVHLNARTNSSTGLHIGISLPDHHAVDYTKLILFLGDKTILSKFRRTNNIYCKSSLAKAKKAVADYHSVESALSKIADDFRYGIQSDAKILLNVMSDDKNVSVNFKKTYVEFRAMGGDYLSKQDLVINTVNKYIKAYALASDPTAAKEEYAKKLMTLFPTTNGIEEAFVNYSMGVYNFKDLTSAIAKSHDTTKFAARKHIP